MRNIAVASVTALSVLLALAHTGAQQATPQTPVFRTGTTLVPVDVRVVDKNGKPVPGLTRDDFTVIEDGVPQDIRHFSIQTLVADASAAGRALPLRGPLAADLTPQNRRIFLIVFGRVMDGDGGLDEPARSVEASIRFVREKLLPQDQVAVMAYNRATDFTSDHAQILAVLERFSRAHKRLDSDINNYFTGWAGMFKGPSLPEDVQRDVDAIFAGTGSVGVRQVTEGSAAPDSAAIRDARGRTSDAQRADDIQLNRLMIVPEPGMPGFVSDATDGRVMAMSGLSAAQLADAVLQGMQDLGRLFTGINYMRRIDGEKHLVFITPQGFYLPRLEDEGSVAAAANDARVTIDTIQAGGLGSAPNQQNATVQAPPIGQRLPTNTAVRFSTTLGQTAPAQSLRLMSELTGGQASLYDYANKAIDRINQTTMSGYLLGYYPANTTWDGRYRQIEIKVKRSGATVLYRHGYYAEQMSAPDRRRSLTYTRIVSAGNHGSVIRDLKIGVKAEPTKGDSKSVTVNVSIDLTGVAFAEAGGLHTASLNVTIFCADADREPIGDAWQTIDLSLNDVDYERVRRQGTVYSVRVPVKGQTRLVKVVVYNYAADRVGTAVTDVR